MGLIDDLKGLSSSISSFSDSLHNLISIKQRITQQQATIELEKKMNEIIQRQFRDIDDPAKITQDTYKQALAEYDNLKQRILETYSAPFEKPVAQDVINQYDKTFVNNFAAAYYEKYAQGLRNDYLTLVNAKLNLIKDDDSFEDFLNTVNDKKFHAVLAPEDIPKVKQLERQAKGTFLLNKAMQAGMKGEDAAAFIASGGEIGGYKLETPEEQSEFITSVWPGIKQKTLDSFKTTYDDLQQRFNKKEISWKVFKDTVEQMKTTQENLGIINNSYEYSVRNAGFNALMADIDVIQFWGEKVVPLLGTAPSYGVSEKAINEALQVLNVKREEYFDKGYHGAVDRIDELSKYVRSLGSSSMPGGIKAEERMMRLTYLEYEARFQNYNAIGEIEAMAMDTNENTTVRLKAVQTLTRLRSDVLTDPEKVASFSAIWSSILQDKDVASKYSAIVDKAQKGDGRAKEFLALIRQNIEKISFEYAKTNYTTYTDEKGRQVTTETVLRMLSNVKAMLVAYEQGQTGATGTVGLFGNSGAAINAITDMVTNNTVDFVDINKSGFQGATTIVKNAITELANKTGDKGLQGGQYVGVMDDKQKKRLFYVTPGGEVYEIKPDGVAAKAEKITNPKDSAIPPINSLLKENEKGLSKKVKIDIIPTEKVKDKEDKTIMSYLPKGYTANEGSVVYRTNYDNIYIYDHVSKSGSQGKFFRVFVEVKNPGSKGKIIKAIDMSKGM